MQSNFYRILAGVRGEEITEGGGGWRKGRGGWWKKEGMGGRMRVGWVGKLEGRKSM